MAPRWYETAQTYLGTKEVPGKLTNNPLILQMWQRIRAPFSDDETPWCAAFVGNCLEIEGIKSTRSAAARSYANWGLSLGTPTVGAILVFERGPTFGHVGFYVGEDDTHYYVLGGNQGDQVSVVRIPKARCIAIRWPADEPLPATGRRVIKTGSAPLSTKEA